MKKISLIALGLIIFSNTAFAALESELITDTPIDIDNAYLEAAIQVETAVELGKSTIFDASNSFLINADANTKYQWDFGDGNKNEGIEVLHSYKEPGNYTVTLSINDGSNESSTSIDIFVYKKLITLITDQSDGIEKIELVKINTNGQGILIETLDSFGSSTEFISEEILTKKLNEKSDLISKSNQIIIWTKGNSGMNALSRFVQKNKDIDLSQKEIAVLDNSLSSISRIQKQFQIVNPKDIIVAKEAAIIPIADSEKDSNLTSVLEQGGYEFRLITEDSGKVKPWSFMSYFVNFLINEGIPDNTIALLLLLPIIATVVVFMKQVVGMTTFGIYTPSIMTLSFLIIGLYAGLLTLLMVVLIGGISRKALQKVRMLFIPKMAIIMTFVALMLLFLLMASSYLGFFDAEFLSIAIFPMLILSTFVEKFVSVKSEKGFSSAVYLMTSTVFVAIVAYVIAGGEVNFGFSTFQFEFIKNVIINYPELVLLSFAINVGLGKWTGLRVLERVRFREIFRHIEE
jgi:PKD repeat protein